MTEPSTRKIDKDNYHFQGSEDFPVHQVHAGALPQDGVLHIPLHNAHPRHQRPRLGFLCRPS